MIFRKANLLQINDFKKKLFFLHEKELPGFFNLEESLKEIPNSKNYLITRKKKIIGFISFIIENNELIIKRIYVNKDSRRKKIATKLIFKLLSMYPQLNKVKAKVYLEEAKLFFKQFGFKVTKEENKITWFEYFTNKGID